MVDADVGIVQSYAGLSAQDSDLVYFDNSAELDFTILVSSQLYLLAADYRLQMSVTGMVVKDRWAGLIPLSLCQLLVSN